MWSQQKRISLIEDLENTPCLWDVHGAEYRNSSIKSEALAQLAKKYEVDSVEMDKKIQALKSQFRREHKKVLDFQKSGSLPKGIWFGYDRLLFLLQSYDAKGSRTSDANASAMLEEPPESFLYHDEGDVLPEDDDNDNSCSHSSANEQFEAKETLKSTLKRKDCLSPLKSQKKKTSDTYGATKAFECMTTLTETVFKRDEYSIYGEHVGNKLRSSGRSRLENVIAQNEIDNICFKLTMGGFADIAQSYQQAIRSNHDASDNVPSSSPQPSVSHQTPLKPIPPNWSKFEQ